MFLEQHLLGVAIGIVRFGWMIPVDRDGRTRRVKQFFRAEDRSSWLVRCQWNGSGAVSKWTRDLIIRARSGLGDCFARRFSPSLFHETGIRNQWLLK